MLDFEQFTIHRAWDAAPELRLRKNDSAATPVQVSGGGKVSYVFDHSQAAARALWHLASSNESQVAIAESGGISPLVGMLSVEDVRSQEIATVAISRSAPRLTSRAPWSSA